MPQSAADKLVKELETELYLVVDGSWLGQNGWRNFRNIDRPETSNPVEMAIAAFCCLCLDDGGHWIRNLDVTKPFFSFLAAKTGRMPSRQQFDELLHILSNSQDVKTAATLWFRAVYR